MDFGADFPLNEHCKALVDPQILPVSLGDQVARPGVGDLVRSHEHLRPVFLHDWGRHEGQMRVFHSTDWEAGRLHQHCVCSPEVRHWIHVSFGGVEDTFEILEHVDVVVNHVRFTDHIGSRCAWQESRSQISHCNGQKIWRNFHSLIKLVGDFTWTIGSLISPRCTHVDNELFLHSNCSPVGCFHWRRILEWSNRSAVDGSALCVHVRKSVARCLLRGKPVDRYAFRQRFILNMQGDGFSRKGLVCQVNYEPVRVHLGVVESFKSWVNFPSETFVWNVVSAFSHVQSLVVQNNLRCVL